MGHRAIRRAHGLRAGRPAYERGKKRSVRKFPFPEGVEAASRGWSVSGTPGNESQKSPSPGRGDRLGFERNNHLTSNERGANLLEIHSLSFIGREALYYDKENI